MRKLFGAAMMLFAVNCSTDQIGVPRPTPRVPLHTEAPGPDGRCKSGYSVATGRNGELVCVPDEEMAAFRARP